MLKIILILFLSLAFFGCGEESSDGGTVSSPEIESIIFSETQMKEKFDYYDDIMEKSDYETDEDYNNRIAIFKIEDGIVKYRLDLEDKYDVNTETLYVYEHSVTETYKYKTTIRYWLSKYRMDILNMNNFPFYIGYAPTEYDFWDEYENRIFYKTQMSADEAEKLHNRFYAIFSTKISRVSTIDGYLGIEHHMYSNATNIQVINWEDNRIYVDVNSSL